MKFTVYKNGAYFGYKWYYDQFHYPLLILESEYEERDIFDVKVLWEWNGNPGNDYTIKLYSEQDDLFVYDDKIKTNMI